MQNTIMCYRFKWLRWGKKFKNKELKYNKQNNVFHRYVFFLVKINQLSL